jgi:hypothetical protein
MIVRKVNNLRKSSIFSPSTHKKTLNSLNESYNSNPNPKENIIESKSSNYNSYNQRVSNYDIYLATDQSENEKKYLSEINSNIDISSQK